MINSSVRVARISAKQADKALLVDLVKAGLANPILTGLGALALNQAAYRIGLWDARPSADGRTYTWKRVSGFSTDGGFHLDILNNEWVAVDPEEIAARNATVIGDMILAATIAYAAAGGGGGTKFLGAVK